MSEDISIYKYFPASGEKSSNRKKIGWFCTYAPEEIMLAGGFDTLRLLGEKKLKTSESYFPINFCPYLKSGWESLMGSSENLSGVVFTNSCDGMRRLYDIADNYLKDIPIFMLDVPRNTDSSAIDFFSLQLEKMLQFMEELRGGRIDDSYLADAIDICNSKREVLKSLSKAFFNRSGSLNTSDYYHLMELSATTGAESFIKNMNALNSRLEKEGVKTGNTRPGIMVIGNFITEEKLWQMFSELDMDIVADDLCISNRYYEGFVGPRAGAGRKKMLDLIARRYLGKPACMRMADTGKKLALLKNRVGADKVQGIIFISLKFCDTMLYSFPLIRKEMAALKIPVLYLEIEYNNFPEGQIKTRMQAFLEML